MRDLRKQGIGAILHPGMLVRHPGRPDWGTGQVQSAINGKVTVNFEHAGKQVLDAERVQLQLVYGPQG
ncbi:MAG: DUF3553 domain-containing protein [Alphaproteobacteria bacterium HGW-Alphaproteobacteria-4]|jgi:hypothetical protein|nr:MAG: DUF3553 domain-containing protein [Alphaproteobacteria bacterium HGW-Alphaproteobacteria-4]